MLAWCLRLLVESPVSVTSVASEELATAAVRCTKWESQARSQDQIKDVGSLADDTSSSTSWIDSRLEGDNVNGEEVTRGLEPKHRRHIRCTL
ncbi:hypothetical protein BJY00DRAFT_89968 [Aspergillus carlsbadensis]|nr:hypothetical protein BJY00DRAFT_89968 [Aspergillus carlsbadensis]